MRAKALLIAMALMTMACSSSEPSISGTEIEERLRSDLGPATGSSADVESIRCPRTKSFGDGDVARCTMQQFNAGAIVLLVTVLRDGDTWDLTLDVQ